MNLIDFDKIFRSLTSLPIAKYVTPPRIWTDGKEVVSIWVPTETEKAKIAAGEPIILRLLPGTTPHPACCLQCFDGSEPARYSAAGTSLQPHERSGS